MALTISILGAGGGPEIVVAGPQSGESGIVLAEGQVQGIYHAPRETEWKRARRQRGGSFAGIETPHRDMQLGFHVADDQSSSWAEADNLLRSCFSYHLDPWWTDDTLARIAVDSPDGYRTLAVQMFEEPEFTPDVDPDELGYGNIFYKLRAAQPFWESDPDMTHWETGSSSGSGTITVSNPTDVEMFQYWVLTPGKWTVPDVSWIGPPRNRVPGGAHGSRAIPLKPVTTAHGGLVIDLDPMHVMMQSRNTGSNVTAEVGGAYYFMHTIPPHTPETELPISVTGAPSGGARAELWQPRLWSNFIGGF